MARGMSSVTVRRQLGDLGADLVELAGGSSSAGRWLRLDDGRRLVAHQPNRPVTYCSVRSSSGLEKIFAVGSNSTSTPGAAVALGVDLGGEERRAVADPGRLLHVVGDDDDRVLRS